MIDVTILLWYMFGVVGMLLINAFIAGFSDVEMTRKDFIDCLFWPVSLMVTIGTLTKIIIQKAKK